jgi:hypothetical protein
MRRYCNSVRPCSVHHDSELTNSERDGGNGSNAAERCKTRPLPAAAAPPTIAAWETRTPRPSGPRRKRRERLIIWGITGVGALAGASVVWGWFAAEPPMAGPPDFVRSYNELGDSYGALNALFSGLAFAGVIVAILLQSAELRLQREELEDTRQVMEKHAEAAEQQRVALKAQRRAQLLQAAMLGAIDRARRADAAWDAWKLNRQKGEPTQTYARQCDQAIEDLFITIALELSIGDGALMRWGHGTTHDDHRMVP